MPIHFGTDGWRAVISDTFTFHNLRMVTQAIADAVASGSWIELPALPTRLRPAQDGGGFRHALPFRPLRRRTWRASWLPTASPSTWPTADAPTPAISYAVYNLNAIGGVMITASHNAPRYNGVKLKSAYGGSALPEQCREVEVYLNDNEDKARGPNLMEYEHAIGREAHPALQPHPGLQRSPAQADRFRRHRQQPAALRGRFDVRLRARGDPRHPAGHRLRGARDPRRDEPRLWRGAPRADRALPGRAGRGDRQRHGQLWPGDGRRRRPHRRDGRARQLSSIRTRSWPWRCATWWKNAAGPARWCARSRPRA